MSVAKVKLRSNDRNQKLGDGMTAIVSPCINVCHMEGDVCIGCLRTLDEIAGWSRMLDSEKLCVLARVEQRKAAAGTTGVRSGEYGRKAN